MPYTTNRCDSPARANAFIAPYDHPGYPGHRSDMMPPSHPDYKTLQLEKRLLGTDAILSKLHSERLWVVNSRRRNGLILDKGFYTEFAGPGAAVGSPFDQDCQAVIPLGNLSLVQPESYEDQQKALRIRLQWIRLTQNFTDQPVPIDRAQMILEQFKSYFDQKIVDQVPDQAFALLVGVLPQTVQRARQRI